MQPNRLPECSFRELLLGAGLDWKAVIWEQLSVVRIYLPFTYLPRISPSFFLVAEGIFLGSVRIACANADPHLHFRSPGMAATVARTTLVAFSAFLISTATI